MTVDIPGYKIVKTLGKGGMATVYLAVQEIFEREVALKVMSKSLGDDPSFGQRFLREARIVSQLVHPNIVTVYDVGVYDGAYYLSMEYVEGKDLKQMRKRIGFKDKISIIKDMGKALDFAGNKGYVHRDIKPENIMVYAKERRAVLMDFGIARAAEVDISVTQAGTAIGTPHYMSPEQAKGKAVDTRADIYGLGVVFYYLLIGSVPYDGDSAVAIGIKHITEAIPLLPHHLEPLQFILDGMMAKDPDDRFQNGNELVAALDIINIDELCDAEEEYQSGQGSADHSGLTNPTLISIQSDLISKGATGGIMQVDDPDRYTVSFDSLASPPETGRWVWPLVFVLVLCAVGFGGYFITHIEPGGDEFATVDDDSEIQSSLAELIRGADSNTEQLSKLPPGIKEKRVAKMELRLEQLRQKYRKDPKALQDLIEMHRQLIAMLPEQKKYQDSYVRLAQSKIKDVAPLFSMGKFRQAQKEFNRIQVLFPEYSSAQLSRLRSRLANRSVIERKLGEANRLFRSGRYASQDGAQGGNNAADLYQEILAIDENIYPAQEGLRKIADYYARLADTAKNQGRDGQATELLEQALSIDSGNATALTMEMTMSSDKTVPQQVKSLMQQADRQIFHGDFYSPKGRSAYDSYSQVLVLDKSNRAAARALDLLLSKVEAGALELVRGGKFDEAKNSILPAFERRGGDGEVQLATFKIDEAIQAAQNNNMPRVGIIRAASDRDIDLTGTQPLEIAANRTIYFRFSYSNFNTGQSLLNAYLYSKNRKNPLTNIQIVIAGKKGESSFELNSPHANFAEGQYYIQITAQGSVLKSLPFDINR